MNKVKNFAKFHTCYLPYWFEFWDTNKICLKCSWYFFLAFGPISQGPTFSKSAKISLKVFQNQQKNFKIILKKSMSKNAMLNPKRRHKLSRSSEMSGSTLFFYCFCEILSHLVITLARIKAIGGVRGQKNMSSLFWRTHCCGFNAF